MEKQHKTKITDVAKAAEVSVATVANALNGTGRVSEAVAKKVRKIASELHYVPNRAARQLKMAKPDSIGVLINSPVNSSWYSQLIGCFDDVLNENNFSMMLSISRGDIERTRRGINNFCGGRVGGIIFGPLFDPESYNTVEKILPPEIPTIFFNSLPQFKGGHVSINLASGAEKVVDYLYSRNCRKIIYLSCPNSAIKYSNTRYNGFLCGMKKNGLNTENAICLTNNIFAWQKDIDEILKKDSLPDALFCHDDAVALEVMNYLHSKNIRIPEDISIVGFDDIREASLAYPPLTTVGGVQEPLVRALWEALSERMKNGNKVEKTNIFIEPELIIRKSVR
ncbi:MAG: LacI family DNA-binding transcriptional regulator [Lentisphaeria bacterium]|nr:LacI family DNA-binding transcriptional regulator [Lentisphaeria bacterium]